MDGFLKFYNENYTEKINVIYDDKTTRRPTGICGWESPSDSTYYMRCDVINDEVGGLAEFYIKKGEFIYLNVLCSNKHSENPDYTHDGAATILLNILKTYVDYEKKEYPSFFLVLLSSTDAKDYYLRQNLQTIDNSYFTYGENPKTLRKTVTPKQKELLSLRGDDGTLPTDFFKKNRSKRLKSKRLNPKKKYDYILNLYIDKKDYDEESLLPPRVDIEASEDVETDGNSLFECILL